jgi:glycosyltransferase involved in cell wall biosynthesis
MWLALVRLAQFLHPRSSTMSKSDLVVFSHLRWSFVHQRPQHLLTRLARHWRVTFIEEPLPTEGLPFMEVVRHGENLTVLVPHTPVPFPGFHDEQLAVLGPLTTQWLAQHGIERPVVWLYTPMALPLVQALEPVCVVYDCMDELSAFQNAPLQLRQREAALMKQAALVLAGGPSLYEAKRRLHSQVHCIPSSVDEAHYSALARIVDSDAAREASALQDHLPSPRLGYFGVIDERMDLALIAHLAGAHPEWQIVMVGPVVKIDPAVLPQRPNIHWLGMQTYQRLPHFLAGWDICLMPFALNEATRFISPTKTLEYMAGGKPVVSTAVHDVVAMYSGAVEIAYTPEQFVGACERLMSASEPMVTRRQASMAALVAASSWDHSANRIHALLTAARDKALAAQQPTPPTTAWDALSQPVAAVLP